MNKKQKKAIKVYFASIKNLSKLDDINDIYSWTFDDDLDDFTNKLGNYDNPNLYIINYRLIITLFMLNIENKDDDFIPSYINELFIHIGEDIQILNYIIKITCKSINRFIELYNSNLISLKSYFDLPYNKDKLNDLFLYRGFNYNRYKPLLNYVDRNLNEIITIPCILSTSVYKHIAKKFIIGERKVLWEIKINNNNFDKFKYSYVKNGDNIDEINLTDIDKTIINESEFIINYGIQLRFINKRFINEEIELYEFEFIDYNKTLKFELEKIKKILNK